jgi:hypothetical protein
MRITTLMLVFRTMLTFLFQLHARHYRRALTPGM